MSHNSETFCYHVHITKNGDRNEYVLPDLKTALDFIEQTETETKTDGEFELSRIRRTQSWFYTK